MQRRHLFAVLAAGTLCGARVLKSAPVQEEPDCTPSHKEWVVAVLERMQTIKPGMSRKQLGTIFTTEGGLSTRAQRTYVSQDCAMFKVKVEFKTSDDKDSDAEQRSEARLTESDDDVIVKISEPYLQFSIMD